MSQYDDDADRFYTEFCDLCGDLYCDCDCTETELRDIFRPNYDSANEPLTGKTKTMTNTNGRAGIPYDLDETFGPLAWDDGDYTVADEAALDGHARAIGDALTAPDTDDRSRQVWFDKTCDQLLRWLRNAEYRTEACKAECDKLKAKLASSQRNEERVRGYLQRVMESHGQKKFKTAVATASIRPGRESIVVLDNAPLESWPIDIYMACVEVKKTVNKTVLKKNFEDRLVDLPGVSVECGPDTLAVR